MIIESITMILLGLYTIPIQIACSLLQASVGPDTSPHVARASGKVAAHWAWRHRNDRVLVTLQHELCSTGTGIPELDAAILGTGQHPLRIRGQGHAQHKVLVPHVSDGTDMDW